MGDSLLLGGNGVDDAVLNSELLLLSLKVKLGLHVVSGHSVAISPVVLSFVAQLVVYKIISIFYFYCNYK